MLGSLVDIHPDLLHILSLLEAFMCFELTVTSGHRDIVHNDAVGGVKDSEHTYNPAKGVDILCRQGATRFKIVKFLLENDVHRIGIGDGFIHIGISDDKPQFVIWTYYPEMEV